MLLLLLILPISSIELQEDPIVCNISISKVICNDNICVCNNNIHENVQQLIIVGSVKEEYYTNHKILINNCTLEIILKNIYIDYEHCSVSPFLANHSDIDLKFEGKNSIYQFSSQESAIECSQNSSITFTNSKSIEDDFLYVEGNTKGAGIGTGSMSGHCKSLIFNGGNITSLSYGEAAGIGTGNHITTEESKIDQITINNGTIFSRGPMGTYNYGSGIGVGMRGTVGIITINGGNVTARGNYGSGIGGGFNGHVQAIRINDGIVTSQSYGASGIGGGYHHDVVESITINGGTINATAYFGAAIGGGANSEVNKIVINNGSIFASVEGVAFSYSAGIGAGQNGTCKSVEINGGNITSFGFYGAGIGASNSANCSIINITGGIINSTGNRGAGIGAGAGYNKFSAVVDSIFISGGVITAVGIESAGIGGGYSRSMHSSSVRLIEISGDSTLINATGKNGAGIGSSLTGSRFGSLIDSIVISEGKIIASGTSGIGGSSKEHLDTGCVKSIEIRGGEIDAEGLYSGIGAGESTWLNILSISGGKITARSTVSGAAIGGGSRSKIDLISITGGIVEATAEGQGGAGIGTGSSIVNQKENDTKATIDTILIGKAKISAKGKNQGAGIGGGETVAFNSSYIGEIVIKDGAQVTSQGGDYAAGIGGGYQSFVGKVRLILGDDEEGSNVVGFGGQFSKGGIGDGYLGKTEKIEVDNGKLVCSENMIVCVFSEKENPILPPAPTIAPTQSASPKQTEFVPTQSKSPQKTEIVTESESSLQTDFVPTQSETPLQSDFVPSQSNTLSQSDYEPTSSTQQNMDESDSSFSLTPAIVAGIAIGSSVIVAGFIIGGIFLIKKFNREKHVEQKDALVADDDHHNN